jgi:hypothetical protein
VKQRRQTTTRKKTAKKRNLGRYKSGLEKTCADLLSESGLKFTYEEEEFLILDSFRYEQTYFKMTAKAKLMSDRTGKVVLPIKYTPDFVAADGSWIIETKGYLPSHHDFPMRWKLFLNYLREREEPMPALFICRNREQIQQAIDIIRNGKPTRTRTRKDVQHSDDQDAQIDI